MAALVGRNEAEEE